MLHTLHVTVNIPYSTKQQHLIYLN